MTTPAPLILVVGMHRSGTSLLGALMQELGVAAPGPLIAGDSHNPEGYLEREDVTAAQEQLLIDLGRWWPSAAGLEPLPTDWLQHPATERTRTALRTVLVLERDRQRQPWLIKDPRTSLLLPLWRELCRELTIPLRLLLACRDPREVGVSLCRRDQSLAGMTAERAQRLWWRHNVDVLLDSQDLSLQVVDYGRWFSQPREALQQIQQLQSACGLPRDPAQEERALAQINPNHRRSLSRFPLLPGMQRLQRRLRQLSRNPQETDRQQLVADLQRPGGLRPLALPASSGTATTLGSWFDPQHYRLQRPDLGADCPPLEHYLEHGWKENPDLEPHPLFQPDHYRHVVSQAGLCCEENPLLHFLENGIKEGLAPSPLIDPLWVHQQGWNLGPHQPLRLAWLHPWGAAAEALHPGDVQGARTLLKRWLKQGFAPSDLARLAAVEPWPKRESWTAAQAESASTLLCRGSDPRSWAWHAWQQHLPLGTDGLNLLDLSGGGVTCQELLALSHCQRVLDPEPQRVQLLQRLGVRAETLQPGAVSAAEADWLSDPLLLEHASASLGLPQPSALAGSGQVLVLGSGGDAFDRQLQSPILGLPGFDQLLIEGVAEARALAAWLQACRHEGLQLIRLNPKANEQSSDWLALERPDRQDGQLPTQVFRDPLDPAAIAEELLWRHQGQPPPPPTQTPRPTAQVVWSHTGAQAARAAVLISLYNYGSCIETALESVAEQTLERLELIVVDDASSDDGLERVLRWLQQRSQRFARALVLQHPENAGLAAARNSAFAAAESDWCFVLDADNSLAPRAVEHALTLAEAAPARAAVVFPLVQRVGSLADGLISRVSWQRQHFLEGNVIDAMALIRRQAWKEVDGYIHIPGGWEDFDFWCSLIDAGWHGVICPEQLATYQVHTSSMLQQQTDRHVRRISRLLQARHPWLQLPMAEPNR